MTRKKDEKETALCPVGRFFLDLERVAGKKSKFARHMNRSRVEFLKAVRSIIDDSIENLEGKGTPGSGKKMTRIEVE